MYKKNYLFSKKKIIKKKQTKHIFDYLCPSGVGSGGSEGNGCAKFVEIATQTVNFTNILTNLNSCATNCTNTSELNSEQMVSSSITSPIKLIDEQHDVLNQTLNPRNINGHCIVDGNSNTNMNDDVIQVTPSHHSFGMAEIDAGSIINSYQGVSTNSEIILKHDSSASVTETCKSNKTHTERELIADETDLGTKHVSIDGVNGPANDLRV